MGNMNNKHMTVEISIVIPMNIPPPIIFRSCTTVWFLFYRDRGYFCTFWFGPKYMSWYIEFSLLGRPTFINNFFLRDFSFKCFQAAFSPLGSWRAFYFVSCRSFIWTDDQKYLPPMLLVSVLPQSDVWCMPPIPFHIWHSRQLKTRQLKNQWKKEISLQKNIKNKICCARWRIYVNSNFIFVSVKKVRINFVLFFSAGQTSLLLVRWSGQHVFLHYSLRKQAKGNICANFSPIFCIGLYAIS